MRVILASQSPRRREILSFFSLPFEQRSPDFAEELLPFEGNPIKYACELSIGKAESVSKEYPYDLILSADTVVYREGTLFGKPSSLEENISFLQHLSGNWHSVFTAVTGQLGETVLTEYEETKVLFNPLSEEVIKHYCQTLKTEDKAGGYAIQGSGGLIIQCIQGCYYNVMGLPINALRKVLHPFGIDLWQKLK